MPASAAAIAGVPAASDLGCSTAILAWLPKRDLSIPRRHAAHAVPRASGISGANICIDAGHDHPSASRYFPPQ